MRLWLLAALAAAVLATHEENYEQGKTVLKSWDAKKPIQYIGEDEHSHEEESPRRSKRSVMSMAASNKLGADKSCQTPGYTGEFCEYPICGMNNEVVPNNPANDGLGATIDMTNLANCSQEYVVLVDDTMFKIRFELESDLPLNPYLSVFDDSGALMFPDQTQVSRTATTFTSFYFSLDPGRYKVIPSADSPTGYCSLIVRAHTMLNVVGGFVTESDDAARNDFPGGIVYKDQASTAMFHANGQRSPGKLITVTFTGNDNTIYRPRLLNTRYNCSYEYFFETFTCRQTGSYLYHIEGVTFEGYNFRRVYPFLCMPAPPTQPPTTTMSTSPAPLTQCLNDGYMVNNLDGSSYCYCHGLQWTGADCSKIVCMNGGTVTASNTCRCTPGYQGIHCEDIYCEDNKGLEFDALHPTLTLVLRTRSGMNNVNKQIMQATSDLIDKLQFDPDYLTSYILVLFNDNEIILNDRYTSRDSLIGALNSTAITSTSVKGDCYDSVFTVLSSALTMYPNNKSPVYIVTDAPPKDIEVAETVFHQDSFWRAPLNFIYIQGDPLCALTPEDAKYKKMDDIAKRSGGMTFYITNRNAVYNFTMAHMINTVYRSQMLLSTDLDTCTGQNAYQPFTIDAAVQQLTVVATGQQLSLNVTLPSGDPFPAFRIVTAYGDNGNYIWTLNGINMGLWNIQVIAKNMGAGCNYKIFQKLYNNIAGKDNTQYDLFWAFAPVIDMNGYETQPVYGVDMGIVAKLTNYPYLYPQYVTAGLNIYANRDGKQVEVYAANGIWRDACDYNFFFPHYTCTVPNEILYFNFYARDHVGMAIQRAGVMYCSEISPTLEPPSDCQHGGVMAPSNTTCYCPLGWSGNKCEQISCFNAGTPLGNKCLCVQGWTGTFCEYPRCIAKGISPEPQLKYVDMVFAVEMTQTGAGQIMMLNTYFPDLLRDITFQNTRWINRFVLTGFNSTWAGVLADAPSSNPKAVIDALAGIANDMNSNYLSFDKGCNVQVWKAFDVAILQREAVPGSYMELFVSSTPDNSDTIGWGQLYDFQRSMNLHINVFQAISAYTTANPTGYFCNGTADDFYWLGAITGSAAGAIYPTQQGNIPQITKTIPNQYLSAIDFIRYEDDCRYGFDYYFPIDAYVQTIQLEVYGANPQVVLYGPDDKPYRATQLMQDTTSYLTISEVRKDCDDDWEAHGQFCYKFHHEDMLSWSDAQSFCHEAKAQLADDMNPSTHSWYTQKPGVNIYNFWIGLFNTSTEWAWDRPPGVEPLPLNQNPTYWEDGVQPTDPNLGCVYYNGANRGLGDTWTADECSEEKWFVCMKHRYNDDYIPDDIQADDLPPGKWRVNIKTAPSKPNDPSMCGVTVRVQSELQIFTGYSQEVFTDTPENDPYTDSNRNRIITYIHSQDNDYRTPILFNALISDAYNDTFYNSARYQERVNCEYPWVSQTFACPNAQQSGNEFMIAHTGEDSFGNMFQRVTFGHCSREPITCGNGGYRWNGLCICDEYWTGSKCTIPICVNNGTLSPDLQSCQCPPGFTGFNCQLEKCDDVKSTNFNFNYKTMLLIVENTIQNQKAIKNLAAGFLDITSAIDSTFFYNYIVMPFDSTGVTGIANTTDPAEVVNILNKLVQTDQGSCSMPLYTAMYNFLNGDTRNFLQFPRSEIVLVTSAGASDEFKRQQDLFALSDWQLRVNYMYVSDTCGSQPADGSLPNLARTAYLTDGNVAFMSSDDLVLFLKTYLPTRFGANVLSNPTAHLNYSCDGTSNTWIVQVDTNTTYMYITTSADLGSLGATGPDRDLFNPEPMYAKGNTKMYRIDTERNAGIYKLSFVSPGVCFASIYSVGGAQVSTLYAAATPTDPTGSHQDGYSQSPFAFVQNVLTAHLEGQPGHRGQLQYAEIFDVDTRQILLRSELYRRDGPFGASYPYATCQFEYVSDPFTCDSELLGVFVYGMDENNIQFRRQLVAHCLNSTSSQVTTTSTIAPSSTSPTTTTSTTTISTTTTTGPSTTTGTTLPPTTSFSNLNILFDVVFLVDTSKAATNLYDQMSTFIQTMMSSYTINQNVHVGLVPVFGSDLGQMFAASLSEITSQTVLVTRLNDMKIGFSDFDDQGQYLASALATATNPNYLANGYRSMIQNHVLVYITSTTDFNDAPDTSSILQQNTYGVITIGFGGATDAAKLTAISGGAACTFSAPDANTLNTVTMNGVKDLIWAANFAGGLYCGNKVN